MRAVGQPGKVLEKGDPKGCYDASLMSNRISEKVHKIFVFCSKVQDTHGSSHFSLKAPDLDSYRN